MDSARPGAQSDRRAPGSGVLLGDLATTVALAGLTVLLPAVLIGPPWYGTPTDVALGLLLTAPLLWRRRAPLAAGAGVAAAGLLHLVVADQLLPASVSALVVVHALAAHGPRWAGTTGLAVGLAGSVVVVARWFDGVPGAVRLTVGGALALAVLAAWALGDRRRARLQRIAALEERARLLQVEHDQEVRLAATAERTRIARELHDVVAHGLAVVVAQADGGRYAGRTDPAAATGALEAIATTGRQALADMRSLLGVLRDGDAEQYAPQPDVAAVPALVDSVRAGGLDVDLLVEGDPWPLPAGPQLAAYRIVQESLTNVLKHAGPDARAWVRLQWRADALELAVLDDGGRPAPGGGREGSGGDDGHGLAGMRERAQLHGGALQAGPRPGGGFAVSAVLPYGERA